MPPRGATILPVAGSNLYETTFSSTENPISEGGRWISGLAIGLGWSDIETSGGRAYGTQSGAVSPPYDDSCAFLKPAAGTLWSADQEIEAQVSVSTRSGWTGFHEVELLLRGTLLSNWNTCYECLFPCTASTKLELVLWKGPLGENSGGAGGNPNTFTVLAEQSTWPGLEDTDWVKAAIVGTTITMSHRTNAGSYTAYISYDTSGDSVKLSSGWPGIGHWKNGNGNLSDHGFHFLRVRA